MYGDRPSSRQQQTLQSRLGIGTRPRGCIWGNAQPVCGPPSRQDLESRRPRFQLAITESGLWQPHLTMLPWLVLCAGIRLQECL